MSEIIAEDDFIIRPGACDLDAGKLNRVEIRPPTNGELELVQRLRHDVLDPERLFPSDLSLGPDDFLDDVIHVGAFYGSKLVSTVRLSPLDDKQERYEVRKMATAQDYRRQGLGGQVLKVAETMAMQAGAETFTLNSRKQSMLFYAKLGYAATGKQIFGEDGIINFTMIKQV